MALKRYDVSNDRENYESWPDLVLTAAGKLICVFCELNHHSDHSFSRIAYVESTDHGVTWSAKNYLPLLCEENPANGWDCARISLLKDGRLAVLCNRALQDAPPETYLWFGDGEGIHWEAPKPMGMEGIVPDKLLETSSGRLIISCHTNCKEEGNKNLTQRLWYSDDKGENWTGPVSVAKDSRYNLCEGSILEITAGTLVCFMRENSSEGYECIAVRSEDDGLTWSEPYTVPLACCHRPTAGFIDTGEIMITYRYKQGTKKGWLGAWTQNTFLAITDTETVLSGNREQQTVRIMPLNYDVSKEADLGYTGWVQFPDGLIYIVDYIRGTEEKCHIIGCSLYREDIGGI